MNEILTIFTPTYNRAYVLPRLYDSLCRQTNENFVWLIVDDGSADDTEKLVTGWIKENKIKIKYLKQENMGKHIAHNKGVENTETELFVCVDSDDWLATETVENITGIWNNIDKKKYVGILAYKGSNDGKAITECPSEIEHSTLQDAYRKYGMTGDTMLVFKTAVIEKYSFPFFKGEKFVPESYLYDLIDCDGELYFVHKVLYFSEYLEDGYTNNMRKTIKEAPQGYIAYINQRIKNEQSIVNKAQDTVRYIAVAKCFFSHSSEVVRKACYPWLAGVLYPIGVFYYKRLYESV